MVCAKCAKLVGGTTLATPSVKRKSEIYHGASGSTDTKKPTQGNTGIAKSKLLSKSAKNPYAAYAASCDKCKVKIEQGRKYCQKCAYKENACAMCGKNLIKDNANAGASIVQGQRFSAK